MRRIVRPSGSFSQKLSSRSAVRRSFCASCLPDLCTGGLREFIRAAAGCMEKICLRQALKDQRVGDLLLTADLKMSTDAGYKIHTPVLVTNSDDYVSVKIAETTSIQAGDSLMTIC